MPVDEWCTSPGETWPQSNLALFFREFSANKPLYLIEHVKQPYLYHIATLQMYLWYHDGLERTHEIQTHVYFELSVYTELRYHSHHICYSEDQTRRQIRQSISSNWLH
jgi:hypothetical protein